MQSPDCRQCAYLAGGEANGWELPHEGTLSVLPKEGLGVSPHRKEEPGEAVSAQAQQVSWR